MFAVLKPEFTPTNERKGISGVVYSVGWEKIGEAQNMEEARMRFRIPVLSNDSRWLGAGIGVVQYI